MSTLNTGATRTKAILAIAFGAVIAALAAFIGSAGAEVSAGDPDSAAGQAVGYGLGLGVIVWAASYFVALKREVKSIKWGGFFIIIACGITGSVFAASL